MHGAGIRGASLLASLQHSRLSLRSSSLSYAPISLLLRFPR